MSSAAQPDRIPSPADEQATMAFVGLETRERFELPELDDNAEETSALAAANQFLLALRRVQRDMERDADELDRTIENLRGRHQLRADKNAGRVAYLTSVLKVVYERFPATGKAKSRKLLAGRLGTRAGRDGIETPDRKAAADHVAALAIMYPGFEQVLKRSVDVDLTAIKEAIKLGRDPDAAGTKGAVVAYVEPGTGVIKMAGEPIPGLTYRPAAPDTFYAEPEE